MVIRNLYTLPVYVYEVKRYDSNGSCRCRFSSTGGAGIQADLKTFTALGVYGAAAITCITVQNSQGVSRIEQIAPELVGKQIQAVLAEQRVTHVKIGMIGNANIAKAVGSVLQTFQGEVVYDPVMAILRMVY